MIWDPSIARWNSSTDSRMPSGVMLRKTRMTVRAPAFSKARAESYSQLVPGNTGMNTVGWPSLWVQTATPPWAVTS